MTAPQLPQPDPDFLPPAVALPTRRRRWPWIAAGAVAIVLASALVASAAWWFSDVQQFKRRDPDGYAACEALSKGLSSSNAERKLAALFEAAERARLSETDAIENSVERGTEALGLPAYVETTELIAACEAQGYDTPPIVSTDSTDGEESASAAGEPSSAAPVETGPALPAHTRRFKIESDGPVHVAYNNSKTTRAEEDVESGWSKLVGLDGRPLGGWSLIASPGDGTTTVTCKILDADGISTVINTASGGYTAYCQEPPT